MTSIHTGAPAWLAPDYRYAGDDWTGANALTYVVYETAPVYAADGVTILTPGVARDLTDCSVIGTLQLRTSDPRFPLEESEAVGAVVNATAGLISLSLMRGLTGFPRQPLADWGNLTLSRLIAKPKIVDAAGEETSGTIGSASLDTDVRVIVIAQTTASLTLTLPAPSDASVISGLDVINSGTAAFTMYGETVQPGALIRCAWMGSAWASESGKVLTVPGYTVGNLPNGQPNGSLAFATNGRALTGGAVGAFTTQAAAAGTGVLVTWCASASVWQIAGTAVTVQA